MAQIGFTAAAPKTYTVDSATLSINFWSPTWFEGDAEMFRIKIRMRGYDSKTYFLTHGKVSHYAPATITLAFQLSQATWPFAQGQDPWPTLWALIAALSATQNDDGEEINGGVNWSAATPESYP